jgi:hypothetical protein
MKQTIAIALLISSITFFSSCQKGGLIQSGKGPSVTEYRTNTNFQKLDLRINADVEVIYDSISHIEIFAQQNIIDVIETKVKQSTLNIQLKNLTSIRKHNNISIKVYTPNISDVYVNGSGSVTCNNFIDIERLDLSLRGSGKIAFNSNVINHTSAKINGSGDIYLTNNQFCLYGNFDIRGSGKIKAYSFLINEIDASINGSGTMEVFCSERLKGDISGSGKIYYKGNCQTDVKISGSGKIVSIN